MSDRDNPSKTSKLNLFQMCSKKLDAQTTGAVFWLVFGLILSEESYRIGQGRLYSPGSVFFPFLAGLIIIGLSSTLTIQSLLHPTKRKEQALRQRRP